MKHVPVKDSHTGVTTIKYKCCFCSSLQSVFTANCLRCGMLAHSLIPGGGRLQ